MLVAKRFYERLMMQKHRTLTFLGTSILIATGCVAYMPESLRVIPKRQLAGIETTLLTEIHGLGKVPKSILVYIAPGKYTVQYVYIQWNYGPRIGTDYSRVGPITYSITGGRKWTRYESTDTCELTLEAGQVYPTTYAMYHLLNKAGCATDRGRRSEEYVPLD